jgi:hypothetical protein
MAHYPLNHHLRQTYRALAALGGLYLLLFGVLGLAKTWGDPFFHRDGDWVLGLRANPAAATLAGLLGLGVLVAALLGGNLHHRVNLVLGWALLAVAVLQMIVLQTSANVFNSSMVNVIVLNIIGLVVLTSALYGKVGTPTAERVSESSG